MGASCPSAKSGNPAARSAVRIRFIGGYGT
jgi:hypothetical protein